jgi:hypothetical protein
MKIEFKDLGQSLGTRRLAEQIRADIKNNISSKDMLVFDFDGVEVISNSFADECFAKLVDELGIEFVKSRTTFANTDGFISFIIKKAICDRARDVCIP